MARRALKRHRDRPTSQRQRSDAVAQPRLRSTRHMWNDQHAPSPDRWRWCRGTCAATARRTAPPSKQYSASLTVATCRAAPARGAPSAAIIGGPRWAATSRCLRARAPGDNAGAVICDSGPGYRNAEAGAPKWNRARRRANRPWRKGLEAAHAAQPRDHAGRASLRAGPRSRRRGECAQEGSL